MAPPTRSCSAAASATSTFSRHGSSPLHWRLFLPQSWAEDCARYAKAGVPSQIAHRTKQQIAPDLLDDLDQWGLAPPLVVADSDYGTNVAFHTGLSARGIRWMLAVTGHTVVLPATQAPVTAWARRGVYGARISDHPARSDWFVTTPVHTAGTTECEHVASTADRLLPQRTLLVQWKHKHGGGVYRSWINDLPLDTPLAILVRHATSHWCIETDYHETKQALGLGDYEGRISITSAQEAGPRPHSLRDRNPVSRPR
ncbi:transposase [Streptomyces sp. SP2-10]|nr:transposase [Streptomyces sp. SP2-10]